MGHEAHAESARASLDAAGAATVAATLQALSTPSRLLLLAELRDSPRTVTELATAVGMEQSAVSHQLRLLRTTGLVTATRHGRHITYALYDDHVAGLIDQAVFHAEHLRLGLRDAGSGPPADATAR